MITEQDMERNLDNIAEDKPLDIPLAILNGVFKEKYQKETKHIDRNKTKEYREKNKDKIKEYYEKNKDKIKEYYEKNKDKLKERKKEYYERKKKEVKA